MCKKHGVPLDEPVEVEEAEEDVGDEAQPQQRLHHAGNAARQALIDSHFT